MKKTVLVVLLVGLIASPLEANPELPTQNRSLPQTISQFISDHRNTFIITGLLGIIGFLIYKSQNNKKSAARFQRKLQKKKDKKALKEEQDKNAVQEQKRREKREKKEKAHVKTGRKPRDYTPEEIKEQKERDAFYLQRLAEIEKAVARKREACKRMGVDNFGDPFAILGVTGNSSEFKVNQKWRLLADRWAGDAEVSGIINEAAAKCLATIQSNKIFQEQKAQQESKKKRICERLGVTEIDDSSAILGLTDESTENEVEERWQLLATQWADNQEVIDVLTEAKNSCLRNMRSIFGGNIMRRAGQNTGRPIEN
jgi:hypothetical protein